MSQTVSIKCKGSRTLPVSSLKPFQGNLKTLTEANYVKLKGLIQSQGFSFPVFVWHDKDNNVNYLLDGHQRVRTLEKMISEGFQVGDIPVADVQAQTFKEAKKKLLAAASQFGNVDKQGLYEFMSENEFEFDFVNENFSMPEIDFGAFQEEFYDVDDEKDREGEDDVPEVNQKDVKVKPGDIWLLGAYWECEKCGDQFEYKDGKLMNGECPCG